MTELTRRGYGWRPDHHDGRDYRLADHVTPPDAAALPSRVDLRETGNLADPIFDQGQIGSCTANAIASAAMYAQRAQKLAPHITPARLAIYYWERALEHSTADDAGAELRDGLKVVAGQPGYVDEAEWPYDTSRFAVAPPQDVIDEARQDRATKYMRVAVSPIALRQALALGYPVIVGFDVFQAIESAEVAASGELPMPARGQKPVGGHAVLCVGYDDASARFLCRNSWGDGWGQAGYFTIPYAYLGNSSYAQDFWAIELVTEGGGPTPAPSDPLHELAAILRPMAQGILDWLAKHGL